MLARDEAKFGHEHVFGTAPPAPPQQVERVEPLVPVALPPPDWRSEERQRAEREVREQAGAIQDELERPREREHRFWDGMPPVGPCGAPAAGTGSARPGREGRGLSTDATELRSVQAARIPVDYGHRGASLGEVVHLECDRKGALWCVAHVDDDIQPAVAVRVGDELRSVDVDLFWSMTRTRADYDIDILSVALTTAPAQIHTRPLVFLRGELDHRDAPKRWQLRAGYERELLFRAALSARERRAGLPIHVHVAAIRTGQAWPHRFRSTGSTGGFSPRNRRRILRG
jgi:hypothetical protein